MSEYPRKHAAKYNPNQVESAVMVDLATGLTEPELLLLSQRPPVPEDQPMPCMSNEDQKLFAACKDTILVTQKGKAKEALLVSVFHRSRFYRHMGCATFEGFAWDIFQMSRTTAYETLYFADVVVTMAAAGVTAYPSKSQALDLRFLKLTQEEQVVVWKVAVAKGAHVTDTHFMAALEESKLVDKANLEELRRKKAISNGRPKTNTEKATQPADKAHREHLLEIARTLARPENSELLSAIERASEGLGCSVAEFLMEAAREKLGHSGERKAAPEPSSDTEAVETEVEADSSDSNDSSIPSKCDEAVHAVPPEVRSVTACPLVKGTGNFEELRAQMLDHSAATLCFEKAEKTSAKGRMKRVPSVSRGKAMALKSSG